MSIKKILILGSGGREHALADAYSRNKHIRKVYVAPGNPFMSVKNKKIIPLTNVAANNFKEVLGACKNYKIDLVDVAQDEPIALGFIDLLKKEGVLCFGPSQAASEIEWNKEWSRSFMKKYNLPIPQFSTFTNEDEAIAYITQQKNQPFYIKASGLAQGKGAIFADNKKEAIQAVLKMKEFGQAGVTFLVEECMIGEEFSLFVICDGEDYRIIGAAQDHKTVFNKNLGNNTGGMGCVFPSTLVDKKIILETEKKIITPFLKGMVKEKRKYSGVLYVGGMITKKGVKVVEFNSRWGDPEAEVILPAIKTDYLKIVESVLDGNLKNLSVKFDKNTRVSVAGCAYGYPDNYSRARGKKILGLEKNISGVKIYGSGINKRKNNFVVSGGRIFHIVGVGENITDARRKAYGAIAGIYIEDNNLHYRTDIGYRELERENKKEKT
ncbi:MAG: phosphoribosylamine--glycine ligase [Candidatus Levybacteria bacterium]|nr:phosphoribosylamine--glycine ligase [Candidatus Levybacteria bacterium]MBP9814765.1 phosphoribosylamine--glycine ligase [Candidatus Levybacteria bacterium]